MGDFDEMLRAGSISPGSTPFVKSKRSSERTEPAAPTRTVTESVTSAPVVVEESFARFANPDGGRRVLIICDDPTMSQVLRGALGREFDCVLATDVSVLDGDAEFGLVITDAELPALADVVALPWPLVVLGREASMTGAQAATHYRRAEILMLPFHREELLRVVRGALANGQVW